MTLFATTPQSPTAENPAVGATPVPPSRVWLRRIRLALVFGVIIALAVGLYAIYGSRKPQGALDPDAATPEGSRATAVLLRNHGIAVDEHSTVRPALDAAARGGTTILVTAPEMLSTASLKRLNGMPDSVRIVLVEPMQFVLDDLDIGVEQVEHHGFTELRDPDCPFAEATSAGSAEVALLAYEAPAQAISCYDGSLVVSRQRADIVLLGASDPLTNRSLGKEGNAALTLGLLSAHPRLVWLRPTAVEEGTSERALSFEDLLPPWTPWVELMLLVSAVLAILWRSRRLGGPVSEPLPVVVRSAETVEGRARLYRRARARAAAYEALRAGAFARILPPLGLGHQPHYRALVEAIAERSGYPTDQVHAALYGPPPTDDAALVAAADTLDKLVRAVLGQARSEAARHRPDGEGTQ